MSCQLARADFYLTQEVVLTVTQRILFRTNNSLHINNNRIQIVPWGAIALN